MAGGAYIDKSDLAKLQGKMKQLQNLDKQELSNMLGEFALKTQAEMRAQFPSILLRPDKSTGDLRKSINASAQNKQVVFEAGMHYAPYVEFGTGRFVDLEHLKKLGIPESYAMQFKGKGVKKVNLPARPYFFNTIRKQLRHLLKDIDTKLKKIL